jgi:hypothetical protein
VAYKITVYIVDPGDKKIHVEHSFYGKDRAEAQQMKAHHLQACEYFRAAEANGMTDEQSEEIDHEDWPVAEEEGVDVIDMEEDRE